jgi:hypothetical protein
MKPARLILKVFEFHAPLSDAQLAWWLGHFGVKPATARSVRYRLARAGLLRACRTVYVNARGQAVRQWELAPGGKK